MRWNYPPLDINPVFPGLWETIIIIIVIVLPSFSLLVFLVW